MTTRRDLSRATALAEEVLSWDDRRREQAAEDKHDELELQTIARNELNEGAIHAISWLIRIGFRPLSPELRDRSETLLRYVDRLIRLATRGQPWADALLKAGASMMLQADRELPPNLRRYVAQCLTLGIPLPMTYPRNVLRQINIWSAVGQLVDLGWRPTRNYAAQSIEGAEESACSIVARVLRSKGHNISEDAVMKVWRGGRTRVRW